MKLPRERAVGALLLSSLLSACGAGAPAEAVRPEATTAQAALGEAACRDVNEGGEPLVVDWKPEQRGDLEIAMKDGIAVVTYSCDAIKVLSDCKIEGDYGYIGMTRREQVVRLEGADEVRANLPLSGASISGELQRGSTLDIAMMIVGKKRTTWDAPTRDDLKGKCDGATHFVRGAVVGAFAMGTGTEAKVRAAAEIFGAGASAGSTSSKQNQNRDGDVADCQKATPDSEKAPPQCGAPIRLVLAPIAATAKGAPAEATESAAATGDRRDCPKGLVFADGKCTAPTAAASYECTGADLGDCKDQCARGNAASCGILGASHAKRRDHAVAAELLKKGCDGGHAPSCAGIGGMMATGTGVTQDLAAAVPLLETSCDAAEATACTALGRAHLKGDAPLAKDESKAAALLQRGCEGGDQQGCALLGGLLEEGRGVSKDAARAGALYRRACDGGLATACGAAGRAMAFGPAKNEILAGMLFQRGCIRQDAESCSGLGRVNAAKNEDQARRAFEQACNLRDALGCAALKVLYGQNRPFVPNVEQQNQLGARCRAGSAADCASAGLLDVARGNVPGGKMSLQPACTRGDTFACAVLKKVP